jgi:hypothetical protein
VPAAASDAQSLFRTASLQPTNASAIWKQLAEEHRDALAESGVLLLPLVCWAQLRNESSPAESQLLAEKLARAAVETHPSLLTPELLERRETLSDSRRSRLSGSRCSRVFRRSTVSLPVKKRFARRERSLVLSNPTATHRNSTRG